MLIYLGLFFIIPDKFRSRRNLPITVAVGILGACLGLYCIRRNRLATENFGAGLGEACGPKFTICGIDDKKLTFCLVNQRTLAKGEPDQSVVFNLYARYIRIMPAETSGDGTINLAQVMVYGANGSNIAQGKAITSTNTLNGSPAPTMLVNGTTTTPQTLASGRIWSSGGTRSMNLQIDLGSVQMVTSVRIIGRLDCCNSQSPPDRITGTRIIVLKDLTTDTATTGTCTAKPVAIFPTGTTTQEQAKIGDIILSGVDGEVALRVLRGIHASTATSLTNYGLTDSQAAAAYNKMYTENLNGRRAGWEFIGSWAANSRTVTFVAGIRPIINMTVKEAEGIPVGTAITAVSGNTVTLSANTTSAQTNKRIDLNGDMNDSAYFAALNAARNMKTMASITYDRSAALAMYMSQNKGDILVFNLDSAGNQVMAPNLDPSGKQIMVTTLDSAGNTVETPSVSPTSTKIPDNGETAATGLIMGVTLAKAIDPLASASQATKTTTKSPQGVDGYNITAAPNTSAWSSNALTNIPQQTAAINLAEAPPIIINPETTDEEIAVQTPGSVSIKVAPVSRDVMDGGATSTLGGAGYAAPNQSESGVAGTSGGAQKEVFWMGVENWYAYSTRAQARQACLDAGADDLATLAQLTDAQRAGAQWCAYGWLKDTDNKAFPMQQSGLAGCGGAGINNNGSGTAWPTTAGATCFGFKPSVAIVANLPNSSNTQVVNVNGSGRYVRIRPSLSSSSDGWMNFSNIVIKDDKGAVISTGKRTFATSSLGGSAPTSKIVDGAAVNRPWNSGASNVSWHSGVQSTTASDTEYFEVDLGSIQKISTVTYYGRNDCCTAAPLDRNRGVRVEISKIPSPRPFTSKTSSISWNQKNIIDTAQCAKNSRGVQTVKRTCDGQEICMDPAEKACARSCPAGSSWNAEKGMCKN